MRRNPIAAAVSLAMASSLLVVGAVSAQDIEPVETIPPPPNRLVETRVITSELSEPAINEVVDAAALHAHNEILGRDKKFRTYRMPQPRDVATEARDLASGEVIDIIVTSGGDNQLTVSAAARNPNTVFLDIDQAVPCVTVDGLPDPSGTCAGGLRDIPSNYSSIDFAVDQPAYLAGVIAASASRNGRLGIISAAPDCEECDRYIEGFTLGAESIRPGIRIDRAILADDDVETAFGDPATGAILAEAFIDVYQPDVLFAVAGASSRGMIEAACDAGIFAIGSDIDVSQAYPDLQDCVLASVTKDYATAVTESIFSVTRRSWLPHLEYDLNDGLVALTEEWVPMPGLPVDIQTRYENAYDGIRAGIIDTCPSCARYVEGELERASAADGDVADPTAQDTDSEVAAGD